MLIIINNKH